MRWRYLNSVVAEEEGPRAAVVCKIDRWWEQFSAKSQALGDLFANRAKWDLPAWMHEHLNAISPNLMWEYGPAINGKGHRLVITPEGTTHLRPMVRTILDRAPQLPGWEFYPFRLPEKVDAAIQTVEVRCKGDLHGTLFTASAGKSNRIDLTYYSHLTSTHNEKQARHNAFVATETLLGEELLDQWVGAIEAQPLPKPSGIAKLFSRTPAADPRLLPLERLKPTVDALIESLHEQLGPTPHFLRDSVKSSEKGQAVGAVFKLKPKQSPDNEYQRFDDLFVASARDQPLWIASHAYPTFYSTRFSRFGETFCYLKLDGSQGLDQDKFPDRGSIEDALDDILIPARLGCVTGGGTGLRYSYIDLALVDVDAALTLITPRLREGNITRRCWLQFFEPALAQEWIGMYADSPVPPGMRLTEQ